MVGVPSETPEAGDEVVEEPEEGIEGNGGGVLDFFPCSSSPRTNPLS